jgi:hypothetical protein
MRRGSFLPRPLHEPHQNARRTPPPVLRLGMALRTNRIRQEPDTNLARRALCPHLTRKLGDLALNLCLISATRTLFVRAGGLNVMALGEAAPVESREDEGENREERAGPRELAGAQAPTNLPPTSHEPPTRGLPGTSHRNWWTSHERTVHVEALAPICTSSATMHDPRIERDGLNPPTPAEPASPTRTLSSSNWTGRHAYTRMDGRPPGQHGTLHPGTSGEASSGRTGEPKRMARSDECPGGTARRLPPDEGGQASHWRRHRFTAQPADEQPLRFEEKEVTRTRHRNERPNRRSG